MADGFFSFLFWGDRMRVGDLIKEFMIKNRIG